VSEPVTTLGQRNTGTGSAPKADAAAALLTVVEEVARELHPSRRAVAATLDSRLDRDLGIDSLGRAELIVRIERAFAVTLPERTLAEAETAGDLLAVVLARHNIVPLPPHHIAYAPPAPGAIPEPVGAVTLCAALDWHAAHHPDRLHIILEESEAAPSTISYGALAENARRAACGLRELDVAAGDRVAIMLPTSDAFFIAFFGALYAGAVPVPIYPPARASQIEDHLRRQAAILDNAGATVLIATPAMHAAASLLRSLVYSLRVVASVESLPDAAEAVLPRIKQPEGTALLQYTSGSTGAPKGVVLSHANLLANIRAMGAAMGASASDVFVSWLPLYHDMGLIGAWLGSLYYAAPLVVMPPQSFLLRPERWLWAIHRHRGTLSAAPNFAFELCVRNIDDAAIEGLDLSSLRLVANGSEPVSAATLRRFLDRFGPFGFRAEVMAPAYGLAENAVGLTLPPRGQPPVIERILRHTLSATGIAEPAPDKVGAIEVVSCGPPLPGHEIRVVDDTGRELGERHEGRVQFRGPSATSGYFRDAAKTRELFSGDWLESGDLGYIAGGSLFVTGRTKDIIIRGGRHIHPSEIEEAVGELPGLQKGGVAAFGSHDPTSGTERLVVLAETTAPREQHPALRQHIAEATIGILEAPPEGIVLVAPRTLPKTASGKLRRAAAQQLYETGRLETGARSLRRQMLGLGLASVLPGLRRMLRGIVALLYACYWWAVVGLMAPIVWVLVITLPMPAWRWTALRIGARAALRLTGAGLVIEQHGELPANAVIVSNHASYIDGLALAAALPGELCFVAKHELVRQPIARLALRALGTLFVERDDIEQGIEDIRHAAETARSGKRLVFFPEGTLTRAPGLMPFKLGAFAVATSAGVPIIPVAIRGTRSILRGDQWFPRPGRIIVTIAAAIAPQGITLAEAARVRDAVRAIVLKGCGEPDLEMR
jgi:1-acyl-sn-glycerol-3-phosphate acyltransferase